jgi:hypothetical protein
MMKGSLPETKGNPPWPEGDLLRVKRHPYGVTRTTSGKREFQEGGKLGTLSQALRVAGRSSHAMSIACMRGVRKFFFGITLSGSFAGAAFRYIRGLFRSGHETFESGFGKFR